MCRLLVGLDVDVVGVIGWPGPLRVHVACRGPRPACRGCSSPATIKQTRRRGLVDLPAFGRRTRLVWLQRRWRCRDANCPVSSWVEVDDAIVHGQQGMTVRACRWATEQVGRHGRSVSEVADDLGCDWHTVNRAVIAYGTVLIDDPDRIGPVATLGLDETAFVRRGPRRHRVWSTQLVGDGRLLDVVQGRDAAPACAWLASRPDSWINTISHVTIDLSGAYRSVADTMLPDAVQVADPFHVVKLANQRLDETRRRVQNATVGHRGRKDDPLYRARRLLVMGEDRLDESGTQRRGLLLAAGDPRGEVADAWTAKEAVREIYRIEDPKIVLDWVTDLADIMDDRAYGPEVRKLGRTLRRWAPQIAAWHSSRASNGPTEAINNLCKRVKRVAFGITNWCHWRIRVLLYAGAPDWSKLDSITPTSS